jgi:flavin reductase (DIM6/NTAB) family NADH-FMN oxidoreductase RutF
MGKFRKKDYPLDQIRRYLEPGPIVLVSSAWKKETNIMTMGWHMMMGFSPALVGCYIWDENHSFEMIRRSKECVINLPTTELTDQVIEIGNSTGSETDKFSRFELTPVTGRKVGAPLIDECYANFECRLVDGRMISKYSLFIFEALAARAAASPKYPETLHYRGDGVFMVSGRALNLKRRFKNQNL